MAFQAWRLSTAVDQKLDLRKGLAWLEALRSVQMPDAERSKVQLCSELGAGLVAFVVSPQTQPGMYGLVDIGAWTTEISFFNLAKSKTDGAAVSFYSGKTERIGVTEVDERALRALYELWSLPIPLGHDRGVRACVREIRQQRESGDFGREALSLDVRLQRVPTPSTLQFPRDCTGERIRDSFRRALVSAGEKDRSQSTWEGFPIYVIGGGKHETSLWERLTGAAPVAARVAPLPWTSVVQDLPASIADRFVIAAGLAVPLPLWHDSRLPHEVEPYRAPAAKPRPTSEELGYDEK
jgi:hypothetical protein